MTTDNSIIRKDGATAGHLQESLATIDDSGSINIPAGETYDIDGTPHTHAGAAWDGDITDIDETSSADIGAALADADQFIVYDATATAWVRSALSRVWTYVASKISGGTVTAAAGNVDLSGTDDGYVLTQDGSGNATFEAAAGGSGLYISQATLADVQSSSTEGGTFSAGEQTRVLNTEVDPDNIVSLSSNQFTPSSGDYRIIASAPTFKVGTHKLSLYNVTGTSRTLIGQNAYARASDNQGSTAHLSGFFTANGTDVYELRHQCSTTFATQGFGVACSYGYSEVYAFLTLLKLS